MGGPFIDILALVIIASFAWAGSRLGLIRSAVRLAGAAGALGLALVLRGFAGSIVGALTPFGHDLSTLLGMLGIGAIAYMALAALVTYYAGWVPHEHVIRTERAFGAIPGATLGVGWVMLMAMLLVLSPSDSFVSRAAIKSVTGTYLIEQGKPTLQWMTRNFPTYTQTLPKGKLGSVVKSQDGQITIHSVSRTRQQTNDAGTLLANINELRAQRHRGQLQWNIDLAIAANSYSASMFKKAFFSTETPESDTLHSRSKSSIGASVDLYDTFGELIVWSHSEANAFAALIDSESIAKKLIDNRYVEVGIGVADGGWFNGRMYTILLIGHSRAAEAGKPPGSDDLTAPGSSGTLATPPPSSEVGGDSQESSTGGF